MEERPKKPRVIYNPNRNNSNSSDEGVDGPRFTSHLTPHLTSGVVDAEEPQDALAAHLSETFRSEMYWEVHKARHYPRNAGSSLDTSLEEFEETENEEDEDEGEVGVEDDREAFEDESEDGADGGDEARGGGGSEESGCETEATLKASGTDKEDGSSALCGDTEVSDADGGGGETS